MSLELDDLLTRIDAFDDELEALLSTFDCCDTAKCALLISMSELALEHGRSLRLLIAHGHLASALALLRIQLDAIIRTVWIHFAASDDWVASATTFQSGKAIKDPTHALTMTDLLSGIERSAPPELHRQLAEFKNAAWPALSSYVHSGIWPVLHGIAGDEVAGAIQTLRNSCGLTGMAAMMTAVLTGSAVNTASVKLLQLKHKDVLPPLREPI